MEKKRNNIFRGLGIALITPFTDDNRIDYAALERLIEYQIEGGADFFCVLATTGETPCLTQNEKKFLADFVVKTIAGRKPIVMGCGGNSTSEVVEEIQSTDFSGIDGVLSVCPFYNRPSQEGLFLHFKAISDVAPLPVVLYNVPRRTGVNMQPTTVSRLANECDNIVAIKEAAGLIEQAAELISCTPADFDVLSGDDKLNLSMIERGAVGAISVVGNVLPRQVSRVIHSAMDGKMAEAQVANDSLFELYTLLFVDGNPAGVKAALSLRGMISNNLRLPLLPARSETINAIKRNLDKLDAFVLK